MPAFIENGELVIFGMGTRGWPLDHGSPLLESGQPCSPERGPQHLLGRGFTRVEWACLLVYGSCAPAFRGKSDQDVGRKVLETPSEYLLVSAHSWLFIGNFQTGLVNGFSHGPNKGLGYRVRT
jgi:hypothetical protein